MRNIIGLILILMHFSFFSQEKNILGIYYGYPYYFLNKTYKKNFNLQLGLSYTTNYPKFSVELKSQYSTINYTETPSELYYGSFNKAIVKRVLKINNFKQYLISKVHVYNKSNSKIDFLIGLDIVKTFNNQLEEYSLKENSSVLLYESFKPAIIRSKIGTAAIIGFEYSVIKQDKFHFFVNLMNELKFNSEYEELDKYSNAVFIKSSVLLLSLNVGIGINIKKINWSRFNLERKKL